MQVFRYKPNRPVLWYTSNPEHSNHFCLYCGTFVGPGSSTQSDKEHLIARRFVPTGSLDVPGFNFIFRACRPCNAEKADAERHISSVTLFNSPARAEDPEVDSLARRKAARDHHPKHRGTPVDRAFTDHTVQTSFGAARFTFSLVAPPQPDPRAVALLATRQIQGLFALVTNSDPLDPQQVRLLATSHCQVLGHYGNGDWGNPQLLAVVDRAVAWEARASIVAAEGYFKAKLLRSPVDEEGWFWALEWNQFLRIIGTISLPETASVLLQDLPQLDWTPLPDGSGRIRVEVPLEASSDTLFDVDDPEAS